MAQIQAQVGLISGINYGALISQLISLDQEPVTLLQDRVANSTEQEAAFSSLSTSLSAIQTIGNSLALPQTFAAATANSSDTNVLTATAGTAASVGSYQFQVERLVSTQQTVSQGFGDTNSSPVGAGTLTFELGGGEATTQTTLASLNGGAGVPSGQFQITDRAGNTAVINTTGDVNLDDVISQINNSLNIDVHASLKDGNIVLTDTSGKTTNNLAVADIGGGTTAASLGIAGSVASSTLTGSNINYISNGTSLNALNDGRGIRLNPDAGNDLTLALANGSTYNINLSTSKTVGDVLTAINTATAGKATASIASNGRGLTVTDNTTGSGTFAITNDVGSEAATDLGLTGTASGSTITGAPVLASLDSVLVSSLNGGSGVPLGAVTIVNRNGQTHSLNLAGASSVSDILSDINSANAGVTASLNASQTGIQLTDTTGGSGNLVVSDGDSNDTATALGIAGTFSSSQSDVGSNLHFQYISQNTTLSSYNGGQGVTLGTFAITNSAGRVSDINLAQSKASTIGDVINAINSADAGVTASINANGNGLLLTDTAGGAGTLTVADDGSTTAADLNIAGTATGTTLDGSLEKSVTVTSSDTLTTLEGKINSLGFGVSASIINDGSSTNPYRLALTSLNSGSAGRVVIDGGSTNLNPTTLVAAQDAAVLYGGTGNTQPLLITSSSNQLSNIIPGVTVSLVGASDNPVTLNISQDPTAVSNQLDQFTTDFNAIVSNIQTLTNFNTTTDQGSLLLGNSTAQEIHDNLYNILTTNVQGAGQYTNLAQIGISVGSNGQLTFDPSAFAAAFANDPTGVTNLFSQAKTGLGNVIANQITSLTDPINGAITLQQNTLQSQVTNFQNQITQLNTQIAQKQSQLETTFANLETTLATLQSQQSALSSFTGTASTSTGVKTSTLG
jgi:flagellar hook-associated protein 2